MQVILWETLVWNSGWNVTPRRFSALSSYVFPCVTDRSAWANSQDARKYSLLRTVGGQRPVIRGATRMYSGEGQPTPAENNWRNCLPASVDGAPAGCDSVKSIDGWYCKNTQVIGAKIVKTESVMKRLQGQRVNAEPQLNH